MPTLGPLVSSKAVALGSDCSNRRALTGRWASHGIDWYQRGVIGAIRAPRGPPTPLKSPEHLFSWSHDGYNERFTDQYDQRDWLRRSGLPMIRPPRQHRVGTLMIGSSNVAAWATWANYLQASRFSTELPGTPPRK